MAAAQSGDVALVRRLIKRGARVDATDFSGLTALLHAAMSGRSAAAAVLVEAGGDVDVANSGETPHCCGLRRMGTHVSCRFCSIMGAQRPPQRYGYYRD